LKDSLLNANFTGYLNKYETQIFTFDANENPLYNDDFTTFTTLTTILKTQGKPPPLQTFIFMMFLTTGLSISVKKTYPIQRINYWGISLF
jgi:hypothetical protein